MIILIQGKIMFYISSLELNFTIPDVQSEGKVYAEI